MTYELPRGVVPSALPNLLGRGVAFPIQRSPLGGLLVSEGVDRVEESIIEIITTPIGEGVRAFDVRDGVPYGTRLKFYLFESVEQIKELAGYEIPRAIDTWEPRVILRSLQVGAGAVSTDTRERKTVRFAISYTLRATNRTDNLVVPFVMRRVM